MPDGPQRAEPNALITLGGVALLVATGALVPYALIFTAFAATPPGDGDLRPGGWDDVMLLTAAALGLAALAGAGAAAALACLVRGIRGRWPGRRLLMAPPCAFVAVLAVLIAVGQATLD